MTPPIRAALGDLHITPLAQGVRETIARFDELHRDGPAGHGGSGTPSRSAAVGELSHHIRARIAHFIVRPARESKASQRSCIT